MTVNWRKYPDRAVAGWTGTRIERECSKIFDQNKINTEIIMHDCERCLRVWLLINFENPWQVTFRKKN